MTLRRKLNQTVAVYRGVASRSATGAVTRALPDSPTSTCAGRLRPLLGGAVRTDHGEFLEADAELLVAPGADIRPRTDDADADGQGDWVRIDGVTYRVLSGRDTASRGKVLHFLLKREG